MSFPKSINGKKVLSFSRKSYYGMFGNVPISYIAIVYDEHIPGYISYECNDKYEILGYTIWYDDSLTECKDGIQITYSKQIEWAVS